AGSANAQTTRSGYIQTSMNAGHGYLPEDTRRCSYFARAHLPVSVSAGVAAVAAAGIAADGGIVLRPLISRKTTVPGSLPLTYIHTSLMLLRSITLSASGPLNYVG